MADTIKNTKTKISDDGIIIVPDWIYKILFPKEYEDYKKSIPDGGFQLRKKIKK